LLRYTTDRARPGLVAFYDIRPGNGAGQFLQPRSPHGAAMHMINFFIWIHYVCSGMFWSVTLCQFLNLD